MEPSGREPIPLNAARMRLIRLKKFMGIVEVVRLQLRFMVDMIRAVILKNGVYLRSLQLDTALKSWPGVS